MGVSAVELGPLPRLTIAATMAEAMTALEEQIIRRSRILAEHDVSDLATLRSGDAHADPLPQLLLIADVPDPTWHKRLATAVGLGQTVDIGAVLLGDWPHGTTLTVAADCNTTGDTGQRLSVLNTDTAALVLAILREAYGDQRNTGTVTPPASTATVIAPLVEDSAAAAPDTVETHDPGESAGAPAIDLSTTARRARVRVLGTPVVLDAAGQPVQKLRAKSIELLVYLVVNRAGAPLPQIMEALWPDATMRRATERLSTCVANLRHGIRAVVTDGQPADNGSRVEPVINSGGHYRLNPDVVDVDWWTVLDAYANTATSSRPDTQLRYLQQAIDAIGGGLAEGTDYEWADTDRESVRRHEIKIYAQASDLNRYADPYRAWVLLEAACAIDPLSDELARRAMSAAAVLGDADAVRHRAQTLRQALDEAAIEPDAATEQHAADLLRSLVKEHHSGA
jgi:two-component SAPR family response regulator